MLRWPVSVDERESQRSEENVVEVVCVAATHGTPG